MNNINYPLLGKLKRDPPPIVDFALNLLLLADQDDRTGSHLMDDALAAYYEKIRVRYEAEWNGYAWGMWA